MIAALLAKIISWRPTGGHKPVMAAPQLSDNLQMEKEDKDEMIPLLSDNLHMVEKEDNNRWDVYALLRVLRRDREGGDYCKFNHENRFKLGCLREEIKK